MMSIERPLQLSCCIQQLSCLILYLHLLLIPCLSASTSPSGSHSMRVTLRASQQRVLVAGEGALWLACEANAASTTLSLVLLDRPEPTAPTALIDKCAASLAIAHDTGARSFKTLTLTFAK